MYCVVSLQTKLQTTKTETHPSCNTFSSSDKTQCHLAILRSHLYHKLLKGPGARIDSWILQLLEIGLCHYGDRHHAGWVVEDIIESGVQDST